MAAKLIGYARVSTRGQETDRQVTDLLAAGVRRDELAGMQLDDVNREDRVIIVKGKGGQLRFISFGDESDRALVAYLKVRAEHAYSGDPDLWLGLRGPMTGSGIAQMVKRRSAAAGVERVFPLNSPRIEKVEVVRAGKVRRAKLYYIRGKVGKKSKIKELLVARKPEEAKA